MFDFGNCVIRCVTRKDDELGTLDDHIGRRVYQTDTVNSRSCPLVELSGKIFDSNVF